MIFAANSHNWGCRNRQPEGNKEVKQKHSLYRIIYLDKLRLEYASAWFWETERGWSMLENCVRVWLIERVKLLHSTLGLLPNACHPACPLPPAHPFLAWKTLERKGETTGKTTGGKTRFRTEAGQDTQHSAIFYQSCSPCCGHKEIEGSSKANLYLIVCQLHFLFLLPMTRDVTIWNFSAMIIVRGNIMFSRLSIL